MATVGQPLTAPEAGWRRYDDNNGNISYSTGWDVWSDAYRYGGSCHYTTQANASVNFKFYGTKLRLISGHDNDHPNTNSIQVKIDGTVKGSFSQYHTSGIVGMVLSFELLSLEQTIHEVEIISTSSKGNIDAIDIDENGYFCHPVLNTVGSLDNMQVGDCIPCKYTAASGANGVFSNFGTGDINDIPVDGTNAPNGNFFFIKVDKGLLIADRILQHSISWNTLNLAGRIEHSFLNFDPKRPLIVRSLTGGVAYADENGNPVLTARNYGGFPTDNEWDKYIINSNLDGKIQPGDNNIWHYANKSSWVKETSLTGLVNPDGSVASAGTFRNIRGLTARPPFSGGFGSMVGTNANTDVGFRPVLEYIESEESSEY